MADLMQSVLGKVTTFITRPGAAGPQLLLFQHPTAGIQIPAGTIEEHETPDQAALREAWEETGLANLQVRAYIGLQEQRLPANRLAVCRTTKVYARPDLTSFDWAVLRRGLQVEVERREREFVHVTYKEWDRWPDPAYISYQITGWAPADAFGELVHRHFFHLTIAGVAPDEPPAVFTDHHLYQPFWAPLDDLPVIGEPQLEWLQYATGALGCHFDR
jgi:8-oxo-dGTP pyrophosphatase MutT (NUDIX family)